MKHIYKLIIAAAFSSACIQFSFAQNPTYTLDINDATPEPCNFYEFDIDMTWTNSGVASNFEYAGGQYFFDVNPAIGGTGTVTMSNVGSNLPTSMQPRNPTVFTGATPWQLRWGVNTFPGAGSGFHMPANTPVKIVRVRIQTTGSSFPFVPLNLTWRNALPNPFTKIFAYVGTTNTDISTPNTHTISISNNPLGQCAPFLTANFYSSARIINQGETVNFFDSTISYPQPPFEWAWTFQGGTPSTSTAMNPANIRYDVPGTYDVSLFASNGVNSNNISKLGYITVLPGCPESWINKVTVKDVGNTQDSLYYGMSSYATDNIDSCLGEVPVPPPPPAGIFDCRFVLPTNEASKKDVRKDTSLNTNWRMTFQPSGSGYPFTFTWDSQALPPIGSFYLKDEITGTLVNVNMRTQNSYTLLLSGINSLKIEYVYNPMITASVVTGWNLVSVPLRAQNMLYTSLFPGVSSPAYAYSNGYVTVTNLSNGSGYWLRFNSAANYNITGYPWSPENMPVSAGWNLIGPFDKNIPVNTILSSPAGIVNSLYFGYSGIYTIADTLKPGRGYWVRSTASGYLYKGSADDPGTIASGNPLEQFAELRFSSGENHLSRLYLARQGQISGDYSLPPVPPQGIPDIRFGSDRFVEELGTNHSIILNSVGEALELSLHNSNGTELRIWDGIDGSILNEQLTDGKSISIPSGLTSIQLESVTLAPLTFELGQNYPNPFNPVTTIRYQMPEEGVVRLTVYDVLGKEVKTLVSEFKPAGSYEVILDAGNLASGVYFYKISAGRFADIKRMIVLK